MYLWDQDLLMSLALFLKLNMLSSVVVAAVDALVVEEVLDLTFMAQNLILELEIMPS
jgi:hypothetical protein